MKETRIVNGEIEEVVIPLKEFQLGGDDSKNEWSTKVNCARYVKDCANFDEREHWCLEKDRECFQDSVEWCTCLYIKDNVLPGVSEKRKPRKEVPGKGQCKICGKMFEKQTPRQRFCPECKEKRRRASQRAASEKYHNVK